MQDTRPRSNSDTSSPMKNSESMSQKRDIKDKFEGFLIFDTLSVIKLWRGLFFKTVSYSIKSFLYIYSDNKKMPFSL